MPTTDLSFRIPIHALAARGAACAPAHAWPSQCSPRGSRFAGGAMTETASSSSGGAGQGSDGEARARRRAAARARDPGRRRLRAADAPRGTPLPARARARRRRRRRPADARALGLTRRRARRTGSLLQRISAVRVGRRSGRRLGRRPLPRQVPVLARDVACAGRHGRSREGARVRAGQDGREAARGPRHLALAQLRLAPAQLRRRLAHAQHARGGAGDDRIRGATSFVTTVFAPTMQLSPTVTPRRMQAP